MKRWMSALLALAMCASAALAEPVAGAGDVAPKALPATAAPTAHAGESGQAKGEARQSAATAAPTNEAERLKDSDEKVSDGAEGQREAAPGETPNPSVQSGAQEQNPAQEGAEGEAAGEPAGEPTGEPAGEPTGEPTGEATGAPAEEATGEPTGEPAGEPTGEPGGETAAPEGYVLIGGERKGGTLAELLSEPGEKTLYLLAKEPVTIPEFQLALLQGVTLLPDPETFPDGQWAVKLMSGETELTREVIDAATDEIVALNISVVELPPEPEETVEPGAIQLVVTPRNYTAGTWMSWNPEFKLSGIPEGSAGYSYMAVIYDERFVPLSGDFYIPTEEGVYSVRFAIMDAQGDVVDSSDAYELMLDLTPPALSLQVSDKSDYTMSLSATDEPGGSATISSGVAEFSLDGGATWSPLGEGESVVHTESKRKVFPPQTILVRDLAGNVSGNEEEIVLDKLPGFEDMGGGGSGDSSSTSIPHASGTGDDSPYASYELALPEGPVEELTLGGEAIDLLLSVDGKGPSAFTAELTAWARENPSEGEPAKDTLLLRAGAEGSRSYTWRINGSVLRKLYNSDISYLALVADGALFSLPTVGFTAGTRYAELKMGGTSTAEFEYEITMRTGTAPSADAWNLSPDCAAEIAVTVAGERFAMLGRDATPEMYPYDVYCGPLDLPDYPYGAYPGAGMEG